MFLGDSRGVAEPFLQLWIKIYAEIEEQVEAEGR